MNVQVEVHLKLNTNRSKKSTGRLSKSIFLTRYNFIENIIIHRQSTLLLTMNIDRDQ